MNDSSDQVLASVDERPSVAAYMQAARQLSSFKEELTPVRVGLLASFTIDAAVPFLVVEAARLGFAAEVYVAPFNSTKQELLDPESGCARHQADVVFVANLLADIGPGLTRDVLPGAIDEQIEALVADVVAPLKEFRKRSGADLVLHNIARPRRPALGLGEPLASGSQSDVIGRLNARLAKAVGAIAGGYVLDLERVCANVGYDNCYDDKMWYLGRSPFSPAAWRALAQEQAAFIRAVRGPQRKCLVLDLDNVLWGGIVGEAGLANIKLGQTYPGAVFRDFQEAVMELQRRGVLLAINSKNNPADVEEVFRSHPDMVLKLDDFACTRINWQDKPQNMREIARELNIGLESLVFFDDNPAEQALMRQALPQVLTVPVPPEPIKYVNVLRDSRAFDRLSVTAEDRRRGDMYREQAARRQLEQSATSVEEFLRDLQMTVSIGRVDDFAFPRVVDLLQKTNQFNLTTRRHTGGQLKAMLDDPTCGVFWLRVADRFGDNGIVGVAIVQRLDEVAFIESFLMSCRVIGRTVETAFLSFLADRAKEWGASALEGEFVPTAKNAPAADFYRRHGFTPIGEANRGSRWRLDLAKVAFQWPAYIGRNGTAESTRRTS
ncbi:MAG TPA: HAD-IIIC family phosphatase [Verrucomicrobiae bacterium]|nr:HAD-IIIC family phosphatase [Verrucomicrobiae bacterium]